MIDLNNNGIPDYKEPWLWKAVWGVFSAVVRAFAPDHTIIYRSVDAVDKARAQLS